MNGRSMIVAVALMSLVGCGPPRRTSLHTLDVGAVAYSLAFAPDGRTLACALRDRILLVDAESGTRIRELGPLPEQYLLVAFSRERLLSAGTDGYLRLWDANRGIEGGRLMTGEVRNLAISPDGRWLVTTPALYRAFMSNHTEATVTIWDLEHNRRSPPIAGSAGPAYSLAVNAEGLVAVGRTRATIDMFDARSGKLLRTLHGEGPDYEWVGALAFSADPPHLLAAEDGWSVIALWDVVKGRALVHFSARVGDPMAPTPRIMAMSFAAGGLFAAGGSSGIAEIWRFGERTERRPQAVAKFCDHSTLERLNNPSVWAEMDTLAMNDDGSLIVTSHDDGKIRIWRGPGSR